MLLPVKSLNRSVLPLAVAIFVALLSSAALAVSSPEDGDWDQEFVVLRNTSEADLMVRVGSINNVGFGFKEDENPFTAADQWSHSYPWDPREGAANGTDRIMLGTAYEGDRRDGYSTIWATDPDAATTRPILLEYDTGGIAVKNALLQIVIDDFQALKWGSEFTVTLNGRDAPFISEVINHVDQTGPVVQVISIEVPESFLPDVASGSLAIFIDETTGLGDAFAIDFVKLLVNYGRTRYVSQVEGTVLDEAGAPLVGATVRVLGTKNVVTTDEQGKYRVEVASGLNAFRASHEGYVEDYDFVVSPAGQIVGARPLTLRLGVGTPDTNYTYFADGGTWERASVWATEELERADELDLIPAVLLNKDLTQEITRAEFAAVVVRVYEHMSGEVVTPAAHNPFLDTAEPEVLKAFNADLAVGISNELFAPDQLLDREQAATMLTRVVKKMTFEEWTYATDAQYSLEFPEVPPFADDAQISPWAKDSVYFMVANEIITGSDDAAFSPQGVTGEGEAMEYAGITREQALVLGLRMVERLK